MMLRDANFLCEIGTEEIPAGYLPPAMESVRKIFTEDLRDERIDYSEIEVYATPRRIAILISGLSGSQREEEAEIKGPSVKAAYDGVGKPTKALEGFMKGNGVSSSDLFTVTTDKGDYVYARKKLESKSTESIITRIVEKAVRSVPFPKRMRWSDKSVTFPRPIAYFLILFRDKVIPFEIDGITASNTSRGHYIQHDRMIEITKIASYADALRENGVIVDHAERKELILRELQSTASGLGYVLHEDEELLDTVTFLVEQPFVVVCDFDKQYLTIPDLVLIAEMREHQKYFSLTDEKGRLVNRFIVISNNPATKHVKAGNERVIAARFNDARFFYGEDTKEKLADRVESLKSVLFHKELGSIYDKVERMKQIAETLCGMLSIDQAARNRILRAVSICKTDLMTMIVFEFPSLQGKIGRIYAEHDGEEREVADAIDDHYRPRFQGDRLPASMVGVIVSLAEKIDNLFGSFSVGNVPKGSHDPYALRRQANAVAELLIRNSIRVQMKDLLQKVSGNYKNGSVIVDDLLSFITARAKTIFTESGFRHDVVDACLSTGKSDFFELYRVASSIHDFRKNEKFSAMLLSFKRMNNIVTAFRKESGSHDLKFNPSLLSEKAEKDLYSFFDTRTEAISAHISEGNFTELYEMLIEGKAIIDAFFDSVLVMEKDTELRDNRLFILESILGKFKNLMDFSKLEDTKSQ